MRALLSDLIVKKAIENPDFYMFSGDHGYALFDALRAARKEQFINAGVSEQAMVGYAAGLTKQGLNCAVYGLAAFVPIRVLEFIKMDVCYESLPVVFLGDGAGLVYNTLGASHQCAEDIASLRCLPHMKIYSPADKFELEYCWNNAFQKKGPAYIRLGKSDKPEIHSRIPATDGESFIKIRNGKAHSALVATGSMVSTALEIANKFDLALFSAPALSDLNPAKVMMQLSGYKKVVTFEEHSISGGLGSIVAEILSESSAEKIQLFRFGIRNRFTAKCGSYQYAIKEHGLDIDTLLGAMHEKRLI